LLQALPLVLLPPHLLQFLQFPLQFQTL